MPFLIRFSGGRGAMITESRTCLKAQSCVETQWKNVSLPLKSNFINEGLICSRPVDRINV